MKVLVVGCSKESKIAQQISMQIGHDAILFCESAKEIPREFFVDRIDVQKLLDYPTTDIKTDAVKPE